MRVTEKVFVVTGGGNGIGREVVLGLLARGGRVAALDISEEGLAATTSLAPAGTARLTTHVVDITDRAAVEKLPAEIEAVHRQIDGVLNVAGIVQRFTRVPDLSIEEIERVMAVNFWGVVHVTKAFLPVLLGRPEASLVNVSSMGALVPVPGQSAYGASKAAVKLLTEGLYAELRGTPVAVTVVFPGGVRTDIMANSGVSSSGAALFRAGLFRRWLQADQRARRRGADHRRDRTGHLPGPHRRRRPPARPPVTPHAAACHRTDRQPDEVPPRLLTSDEWGDPERKMGNGTDAVEPYPVGD